MLPAYLSPSRHGIYYFRWPLPSGSDRKRETLKLSLRTKCPDHAGDLARHLASCGKLMKGNKSLAHLRRDELRTKVKAYFEGQLERYLDVLNTREPNYEALPDIREELADHESFLQIRSAHAQWLPVVDFKAKAEISDADWTDSQPMATNELRRGRRDLLRAVLEAVEGLDGPVLGQAARITPAASTDEFSPLGEALDKYLAVQSREWTPKTTKQFKAYLSVLEEYFGRDRKLGTISRKDASALLDILIELPASRNTKPALKTLSLQEVVKVQGHKTISPKTINSHLTQFRAFFKWAERNGYAPVVLFEGVSVPRAKGGETDRKPFTQEQLSTVHIELVDRIANPGRIESHIWGSLMALYSGARLNEICQLHVADIWEEDGIWLMHISDEGDNNKRLKAVASKRKVPLHSNLLTLGFLDFVGKRSKGVQLFPDYPYNQDEGYGRNLGRWFNESFLVKLGIKRPDLVFHSLRHSLITRLSQSDVSEPIVQCIVGHARAGVTQSIYMKEGFTLVQLKTAIELFQPNDKL